ncbi:MAG: hypothetical protein IPF83_08765 [Rhodanobacteraceae bacterium]|nr:hypothetical protein [Rhodanobacteraceae bacterium]
MIDPRTIPELNAFLDQRHDELTRRFAEDGLVWPPSAWPLRTAIAHCSPATG